MSPPASTSTALRCITGSRPFTASSVITFPCVVRIGPDNWLIIASARPFVAAWKPGSDVDLEQGTVSVNKSRNMGTEAATKTANSERIIPVDESLVEILKLLPSRELGLTHVFVGKRGEPMSKKWAEHNWAEPLEKLGIRHRKFYATRHTFITEMVKAGYNLKGIADYAGTSVAMIEADYCARMALATHRTEIAQPTEKPLSGLVAGPGFEPGTSRL